MKKTTQIVVSVALALVAGGASAALVTPGSTSLDTPTSSSIVFTAVDNAAGPNNLRTFYYDLALGVPGLNSRSFVNGTQGASGTLLWDLSQVSQFANYAGHLADLTWSVVGGEAKGTSNLTQWGALSTGAATTDFTLSATNTNTALSPTAGVGGWITALDQQSDLPGTNVGDNVQIDASNSFQDFYFPNLGALAGTTVSQAGHGPFVTGAGTDNFYWITSPTGAGKTTVNLLGTFNLAGTTLTFQSANVAAVPLPAATWLFLSGVMGLLGLNRRKKI